MTILLQFLYLLLLCVGITNISLASEVEVDISGVGTHTVGQPPRKRVTTSNDPIRVTLANTFDYEVNVVWYQGDQSAVIIAIDPDATGTINTYIGHKFYITKTGDISQKRLFHFEVKEAEQHIDIYDSSGDNFKFIQDKLSRLASGKKPGQTEVCKHPRVKPMNQRSTSVGARFKSLYPKPLDIMFDDGTPKGSNQGVLQPGKETTTNTYEGHNFYFVDQVDPAKVVSRIRIKMAQPLYVVRDSAHTDDDLRRLLPGGVFDQISQELAFIETYKNRTGIDWRHYYGPSGPRAPPKLYMHPADKIGQKIDVQSKEGFWTCTSDASSCQSPYPANLTLEVVSVEPRAYIIENFLSISESDEIVAFSRPRIKGSTVGNADAGGVRTSATRTSKNTWINRHSSPVFESLFRRAADLLHVDEKLLDSTENAEELQVVNYQLHQKYDAHHDWGVSGYPESRYITLLLYLTDIPHDNAGGETSFPKGNNGYGFKVAPKKGSAVLFYNLLADGNADDLALHAALPVHEGEKWLANFWVWDPKRH